MISPSWGLPPRRRHDGAEQIVLAHPEHPLAGNPDVATDPKPSPDLARPSQGDASRSASIATSSAWSEIAGFGPRRSASWPGPPQAAQTRRRPCQTRATHPPPPPQRAEGLRLGLQQFHLHGQLSDPRRYPVPPAPEPLQRGVDPADRFLTPLLEPLYAQLACTGSSRAPERPSRLKRHRPSLAKSQRACRQSLAWGKRGRAKLARIYHRPINSNFLLKIIGHVPVLLGHFD